MRFQQGACFVCVLMMVTFVTKANALKYYVVDTDGGTDGLCALGTLLQDSTARDQLALVTVAGNQWTSLNAAVENVRNFLYLAGKSNVVVAAGSTVSMGDISGSSSRFTGEASSSSSTSANTFSQCEDGRHFPATPAAATAMGLKISIYDVDRLYGFADVLDDSPASRPDWPLSPPAELSGSTFDIQYAATLPSTVALRNLMEDVSSGTATVNYVALSGLTNLALFFQSINESATIKGGTPQLIRDTTISRLRLYAMGNGNALGLDAVATGYILGKYANKATGGLFVTIFAPPLLSRITFSFSSWSEFSILSTIASSKSVQFVMKALGGRKKKIEENDPAGDASTAFFKDHAVDAAFTVMAIIDSEVRSAVGDVTFLQGSVFLSRTTYSLQSGNAVGQVQFPSSSGTSLVSATNYTLEGNTVVRPVVLSIVESSSGPGVYIGEASNNLLDVFWRRWAVLLKQTVV